MKTADEPVTASVTTSLSARPAGVDRQEASPALIAPLVVTITMERENEKENMKRINDAMQDHALLGSLRFTDSVRELSGSLTAGELATLLIRIQGAGKITYKRSRLASIDSNELLPFVLKINTVAGVVRPEPPRPVEKVADEPVKKPVDMSVEKPVEKPVDTPVEKAVEKPAEKTGVQPADDPAPVAQPAQ
jgi:hypothetical protein